MRLRNEKRTNGERGCAVTHMILMPHTNCECDNYCPCSVHPGPVAAQVSRDGEILRVCTVCIMEGDVITKSMVSEHNLHALMTYDPLGLAALVAERGFGARDEDSRLAN